MTLYIELIITIIHGPVWYVVALATRYFASRELHLELLVTIDSLFIPFTLLFVFLSVDDCNVSYFLIPWSNGLSFIFHYLYDSHRRCIRVTQFAL